jgi:phage tail sheath protein FI
MSKYLSPRVYVQEIQIGVKPIEGVSTSIVGFLGETERGPSKPKLVTSWLEYQRAFGGYFGAKQYLPYAVEGFFRNGGHSCYIGRIVKSNTVTASLTLKATDGMEALRVEAIGEGIWGNRIAAKISVNSNTFKLSIFYWKNQPPTLYDPDTNSAIVPRPQLTEVFDSVSIDETSAEYYEKTVNSKSELIQIVKTNNLAKTPAPVNIQPLTGGNESANPVNLSNYTRTDTINSRQKRGLTAFADIDEISIVYTPNAKAIQGLDDSLIDHCELLKDRFAIIDSLQGTGTSNVQKPRETKYAAFYCPWIKVEDSETGSLQLVPPGGHVAGIYARSDTQRGVHKAPANEVVIGAESLESTIGASEQDILNIQGINCIRVFAGRGIRVWGARTLSSDTLWKYVNVRRLFIFLEKSIEQGTQWVVFEPNDEKLRAKVEQSVTTFLTSVWNIGALMGATPAEAFFVKCDRTTMTQNDIDNGRLIMFIGVAPLKPAEFVIFRIGHEQDRSSIGE